jgi:prepilin-type N-terminal cleavage/methylation domain-containing protein
LNSSSRRRLRGFTLIEILVVLAIIATLAAIVLPQLFKSSESGEVAATQVRLDQLQNAIKVYESKWGDYPPSRLKWLKWLKASGANTNNEGSEALVLALSTERKNGPYLEWQEDYLKNCDDDRLSSVPEKISHSKADLFEVVDFWGNPFVYIHCRDYGKPVKYIDSEGERHTIKAQKSKKLGTYHNANSYQMWSFGPNRVNDNGRDDDIANFTSEEDDDEKDEGGPR